MILSGGNPANIHKALKYAFKTDLIAQNSADKIARPKKERFTGDFYTVGEILGHTLKGIGMSLGISTNLEAVTAQYVDVWLERKKTVLQTYHKALHLQKRLPR